MVQVGSLHWLTVWGYLIGKVRLEWSKNCTKMPLHSLPGTEFPFLLSFFIILKAGCFWGWIFKVIPGFNGLISFVFIKTSVWLKGNSHLFKTDVYIILCISERTTGKNTSVLLLFHIKGGLWQCICYLKCHYQSVPSIHKPFNGLKKRVIYNE